MKKIKLLIFLLLPFFLFSQEKEKRLALVIGNANYDKGALKNPVNDARLIAKTLDSLDFEVLEYYNLKTQRELKNAIRKFGIKRDSADIGFVYYAGHGVQIKNENYLLPTQESFDSEIDIEDYAVSVQAILRYLEAKTNQVNILVLDACRDNPFELNWNTTRSVKGGGLAKVPPPTGSLIAFSTDAGQTAADGVEKNSIYTRSLSKNMLVEGINIDQVFRNVRSEVLRNSKGEQRPVEFTQLTGQEFFLNPGDFEDEFQKIEAIIQDDERDRYTGLKIIELILDEEPNNIRAILSKGRVYSKLKEYKRSLKEYNKIIRLDSNYAEVYMYRATLYHYNLKEYAKAIQDYTKAIELKPKNADYYFDRGKFYVDEKKYEKAIIDFKMALTLNPKDAGFLYFRLAYSQKKLKQYNKAIFNYSKVIELNPEDPWAYQNIAIIYEELKEYDKIIEYYNKAIETSSTNARIFLNRANFYADITKEYDKAVKDYTKAIELEPKEADYYYYRGQFYRHVKLDYEKAIIDYKMGAVLNPKDDIFYYCLAYSHEELKQYDKAIFNYSKVIELDPNGVSAYNNIAILYNKEFKDYDKALEYYDKAIEINLTYSIGYTNRALFYEEIKEYDKAIKDYTKAIELEPKNANYYYFRGGFYRDNGNYLKARIDYQKAITIDSLNFKYHLAISIVYNELEQNDKALASSLKVIEIKPNSLYVYNNIASIYNMKLKDYDKALEYYNKEIEIRPNSFAGYLSRAEFYYISLKENDKANDDYLRALELEPEDNNLNLSYINFNFSLKKYKKVIELNNKAIKRDLKDPQADYYSALVYLEQKKDFRALNSLSQSIKKIKNYSEEGYYISDLDLSILDLSKVFIMRAKLYEKFGENELMCEDLNDALTFVKDKDLKTVILNKISTECNN
jgi:tetratricopeptide (TPR) repeat protein